VTLAAKDRHFLTIGYGDQKISHPDWTYDQQMAVGGVLLSYLPFRMKAYYGHIQGKLTYTTVTAPLQSNYSDKADLGSLEAMYSDYRFDLGVAYTRFVGNGISYPGASDGSISRQRTDQITGRITCVIDPRFSLSARHSFVKVSDGRKLYSLYMKAVYAPRPRWIFTAGGFFGERAYYFDNDLLVIFNQNDTQRGMMFGQVETRVWKGFSFSAEYIYTHFDYFSATGIPGQDYSVRYVVAGIKSKLPL
jgi:hypothetical protein